MYIYIYIYIYICIYIYIVNHANTPFVCGFALRVWFGSDMSGDELALLKRNYALLIINHANDDSTSRRSHRVHSTQIIFRFRQRPRFL